jgi:hypothetical protein
MPAVQSLSASQVGGSNKPGGGLDLELAHVAVGCWPFAGATAWATIS